MRSKGFFHGDSPFDHATPTVLAQLSLSSLLSVLMQYILSPLGESAFISMMLVGFMLGPTLWGDNNSFLSSVYSKKSIHVSGTFAFFGSALYMFMIGIKMDMGMMKRSGKKAGVIGFLTFLFPITLNLIVVEILTSSMEMGPALHDSVYYIAVFQSVTTFHVIVSLLADLKLLNSEVGQLAISSSMVSGAFRRHVLLGAAVLGIVVPHGPPLGSALVNKIESFVSSILMPSYFVFSVAGIDLLSIHCEKVIVISVLGLSSFIGKVLGGMLPALHFKIPPGEAFLLGLVMSSQGVSDVLLLQHGRILHLLDRQMYSIMVINMVFLSGTFTPVIKLLYDKSRHNESFNKRTIQHTGLDMEFRIMTCIYHQDSTPCIIRLLEVSNPTARTPMCCYVVHQVQLAGSLTPLLVYHKPGMNAKCKIKGSSHIINAFRSYEQQNNGNVIVNLFTSISPFATIHEEICRLAVEKRTSVVIIPFHRQWRLHGIQEIAEARSVNRHILAKAPCSVGILVDRGTLSASKNHNIYDIGVIFAHGRDDREALAYGLRMAQHPKVALTVIHLIDPDRTSKPSLDMELDNDIISEFKIETVRKKQHSYRQEFAKDSVELIKVIRSVENSFDLILMGRYHDNLSPMFKGLGEWNESPELGFMGDILTSSDSECQVSLLVVQQHVYRTQDRMNSAKNLLEDSAETVGFALGPTLWGDQNPFLSKVYSKKSIHVSETFAFFGCVLYVFLLGIKLDLGMVKRAGRKPVVIGFLTFLFPVTLNIIMATILTITMEMGPALRDSLYFIAIFQSVTTYHVIVSLLADLKLINSELGQLAISSSMISGTCSWGLALLVLIIEPSSGESKGATAWMVVYALFLAIFIFFFLRPLVIRMIEKTSEGKPVKQGDIFSIFIMILGCAFASEFFGHHVIFGAAALGVAVPHGPPLGSALVNKMESFVSSVLLPSYFVFSVAGVNVLSTHCEVIIVVSMFGVSSFVGKVLGGMLPALYFKMPPAEAFSLGLVMSAQGVSDVLLIQHSKFTNLLDNQTYSIMVINMLLLSGTFTPLIKLLYDPSRGYESCKKRTIQHTSLSMEFRVLACIYHQDSTPCLIRLLEISNPTAKSPMCCYVVHLLQLAGSLSPLLVYHEPGKNIKFEAKDSSHIINAFRLYEQQNHGNVIVNLFTSISPFATIHDEVCRLAAEKRTSLVIIPFHKQWRLHGIEDIVEARSVNRHILAKSPCSIGILVDRGTLSASKSNDTCNIGIIFAHGRDDREALAYGLRMAKHPKVALTVIHLIDPDRTSKPSLDTELDNDIISEFKIETVRKKQHSYRQEFAKDCVELIRMIGSVENSFDLILVGRYHEPFSPLFVGLKEWNEFPELGFLGDMLTSSDSECKVSVLVVQQQVYRTEDRMNSAKNLLEDSAETLQIICESNRGWKDIENLHKREHL
ncbi:unnamed protein product [Dovyalis caffra]|uniref:Cation/H+ exchanger domain-containing protein n=1 Tax=Dovyalis caffra TaxID=77055 RepID=A0AAV1SLR3_9ROSI|nr:unnamed protein product [Dovyalis caffra]